MSNKNRNNQQQREQEQTQLAEKENSQQEEQSQEHQGGEQQPDGELASNGEQAMAAEGTASLSDQLQGQAVEEQKVEDAPLHARGEAPGVVVVDELAYTQPQVISTREILDSIPNISDVAPESKLQITAVKNLSYEMVSIIEALDPAKPVVPSENAQWLYTLYQKLVKILSEPDFEKATLEWNVIVGLFKTRRDAFGDETLYRYMTYWPGSVKEADAFRHLTFLINRGIDGKEKAGMPKSVLLSKVMESVPANTVQTLTALYGG